MATYNKDIDYTDLIRQAAAKGDFQGAAQYEQLRNQKIAGEGLSYAPTSSYVQYLGGKTANDAYDPNTDYQALINQAAAKGDYNAAGLYERQRNAKIAGMNMTGVSKTYNYNQIPDYQSAYKPKISDLVSNIENYDYNKFLGTDEYGALRGQYERQGQRAMQDTMGDAAARTGGMASSYAVTAGQQAYGNQMNNLEAAALEMYQNKKNDMRNDLSMYENLDNMDYSRYADQLTQNNANRQFNYNMLSDTKSAADTLTQGKETAGESVGDYSAYVDAGLMTQAQADNAEKIWAIKNPEAAVAIGHKYAALAQAAIAASGSGSGRGGNSGRKKGGGGGKDNTKVDHINQTYTYTYTDPKTGNKSQSMPDYLLNKGVPYDIYYQVGMNRTKQGMAATIAKYFNDGKINKGQAAALDYYFGVEEK